MILQETTANVDQMGVYTQKRRQMTPEQKRKIKKKLNALLNNREAEEQQADTQNVSDTNEAGNGGMFEQEVNQGDSQQNDHLETNTSTKDEDVPVTETVQK